MTLLSAILYLLCVATGAAAGVDRPGWRQADAPRRGRTAVVSEYSAVPAAVHGTAWADAWAAGAPTFPALPLALPPALRVIGEVRTPATAAEADNQTAELAWAWNRGYRGALVVWQGEPPAQLAQIAVRLHSEGWTVLLAYGPEEAPDRTVWPPSVSLSVFVRSAGPAASAWLCSWRWTSLPHPMDNDPARRHADILATAVRAEAPALPVLGEAFWSYSRRSLDWAPLGGRSGAVLLNCGVRRVVPDGVLAIARRTSDLPLFVLIQGPSAYWASVAPTGADLATIHAARERLEARWIDAGCTATITLGADGYGLRACGDRIVSDSLTRTQWRLAVP